MHMPPALTLLALLAPAAGAVGPTPMLELLDRIPDPPANAQEAVKWFDWQGDLVHPGLLAVKAAIEGRKRDSQAIAQSAGDEAAAHESPRVQAAVEAAKSWPQRQMSRAQAVSASSKEFDEVARRASQEPFPIEKPKTPYGSPGCGAPCAAQWKKYGDELWPLVLARETRILQGQRAVLRRDRSELSSLLREGDEHLAAARYGGAARTQMNRASIAEYHEGLLAELTRFVDHTEAAAERAADVVKGGVETLF